MRWLPIALVAAAAVALIALVDLRPRRGALEGRPVEVGTDQLLRGRTAYMRHCHQCHPSGGPGLGPGLSNRYIPGWLIRFQARAGLGAMPALGEDRISDEDLDAAIEYIRAMRGT